MIQSDKPNPFQVLGLPTSATTEEVVERGQSLVDLAATDEQARLYRWAMEQLMANPATRLEYELFEAPAAEYEDAEWERFARAHKKNPVDASALARELTPPTLDDFDLAALARLFLDHLLAAPPGDIGPVLDNPPFDPELSPFPLEVRDVLFG